VGLEVSQMAPETLNSLPYQYFPETWVFQPMWPASARAAARVATNTGWSLPKLMKWRGLPNLFKIDHFPCGAGLHVLGCLPLALWGRRVI
jgi:hypothetical protein